jgi:heat shock protein HtpX
VYEQIAQNKRRAVIYVALFFVTWLLIGAAVGAIVAATSTNPGADRAADITAGVIIAGGAALLGILFTFSSGASMVLSVAGARPADPTKYRELHNIVEALAMGDGMPKPAVYVIEDSSPNAFATGMSPKKAAITVTTGLLERMDRDELEGVLAHEMSHIKNYDVRLILIVSTLIGMAGLLASLVWRSAFYSRGRGKQAQQLMLVILAAGVLLSILAFVVGPLIKLALSRRRESLADASAVELTRNPAGLIGALEKLKQNDQPFKKFNHATASMCIDDPLQHDWSLFDRLFSTHPPLDDRIASLKEIAEGRSI